METIVLLAADLEATRTIGNTLASLLEPGDIIALQGDLGAGKSELARAIIRARLDEPDLEVPSPSFALVQPYGAIVHADLYRLGDESEIAELGLVDDDEAIVLVEWAERAPQLFKLRGLTITLAIVQDGQGRRIEIGGRNGRDLMEIRRALDGFRMRD